MSSVETLEVSRRARFTGDLSAPDPLPDDAIQAAVNLMKDGRLFRYGEDRGSLPEAALLEEEFAAYMGRKYCAGLNSGGCALFVALKAAGVKPGDKVLANAFTLAPVPGAIAHAGGEPVLVDITERTVIDIEDLVRKAESTSARYLMLSYMRGHIPDMDAVMRVCDEHGLVVIEDCAHTMGAGWNGKLTGTYGDVACFSTQTFKHINSGEGGLLVTDDEDIAARAILLSGSYMLYAQHRARPSLEVFDRHRFEMPNCSMRMSSLVASVLRPQLRNLDERNTEWRQIYNWLAEALEAVPHIKLPLRPALEEFVPSSLQFVFEGLSTQQCEMFLQEADAHGVHVKWFGKNDPVGFTSRHDHWRYIPDSGKVPTADRVLGNLCDIRLPLGLNQHDCQTIARVLHEAMLCVVGLDQ
ncbi:MAG: DegT/DnrJ/EryC1/StrS family aminotransferase [Hyphomicrobiales bacterium]